MLYRSHRGGSYNTPENTMPAFEDALKRGFAYIETDPCYTLDGKTVLMHDKYINRTCRNSDGSTIATPIATCDLTYQDLLQYDAGLHVGEKIPALKNAFRGTRVPLLEELLRAAEGTGTIIALDKKIPDSDMAPLFDVVEKYTTPVSFSVKDEKRIKIVKERFPNALFDYDGDTTDEILARITELVAPENLVVWLYLDTPNFAWLTDRAKASVENCNRVKRHARLGIGNVCNPYDTIEALSYDPYVLEI